ncbi:TetR family transcriptional regulator [Kribbella sancticallisti]|uniref:TetR family transcriptional regulator n=1 Tax=Kribbella sancticallisti TaxID=460087 RepID=A0ABP4QXV4_9ACTN
MTRRHRPADETREHVLEITDRLFYNNGIHATGIDQVAREAEVAPTTLYRLFGSKDGLVAAYVENADQRTRAWFERATEDAESGTDAIRAIFDALGDNTREDDFRGCACQLAFAEYPDPDALAHQLSATAKQWVVDRFTLHLASADAPADRKRAAAESLALLVEGTLASAGTLGPDGPARQARPLADLVLDSLER